jgi:hypothetical protein
VDFPQTVRLLVGPLGDVRAVPFGKAQS